MITLIGFHCKKITYRKSFFFSNVLEVRNVEEHEEVELLLEGYRSDLLQMQLELRSMEGQIDDTRELINAHQVAS